MAKTRKKTFTRLPQEAPSPITLDKHQREVVTRAFLRENIFVTGVAGSGKSAVLRELRRELRGAVVCAPTGVAAINCGGTTIHRLFDFPGEYFPPGWALRKHFKDEIRHNLQVMTTLVIDEISMVRSDMMNAIDESLRRIKERPELPFGGVQLIMFGDLFQLPPVVTSTEQAFMDAHYDGHYFFDAPVFKDIFVPMLELTNVYRQAGDDGFLSALNQIRDKSCGPECFALLNSRVIKTPPPMIPGFNYPQAMLDKCQPRDPNATVIAFKNSQVRRYNDHALTLNANEPIYLPGNMWGNFNDSDCPVPRELILKEGMRVMAMRNDNSRDGSYVNGSQGTVLEVVMKDEFDFAEEGKTFDPNAEPVPKYVSVQWDDIQQPVNMYPTKWDKVEYEEDAETGLLEPVIVGGYNQFPLKLAASMSAHKVQGLTLNKVHLDPGSSSFAHGQTYVALSRCTSLAGLTLARPLTKDDVIMDQRVMEYYNDQVNHRVEPLAEGLDYKDIKPWTLSVSLSD